VQRGDASRPCGVDGKARQPVCEEGKCAGTEGPRESVRVTVQWGAFLLFPACRCPIRHPSITVVAAAEDNLLSPDAPLPTRRPPPPVFKTAARQCRYLSSPPVSRRPDTAYHSTTSTSPAPRRPPRRWESSHIAAPCFTPHQRHPPARTAGGEPRIVVYARVMVEEKRQCLVRRPYQSG